MPPTVTRPPSPKYGASRTRASGTPIPSTSASTSCGKWPRSVESLRLTTAQARVAPIADSRRVRPMASASATASRDGRLRLLVSRNTSDRSVESVVASRSVVQRVKTGTSLTVWVPVGSSSSATTRVAAPSSRIRGNGSSGQTGRASSSSTADELIVCARSRRPPGWSGLRCPTRST